MTWISFVLRDKNDQLQDVIFHESSANSDLVGMNMKLVGIVVKFVRDSQIQTIALRNKK